MKVGEEIATRWPMEHTVKTYFLAEQDDFILFTQELEGHEIWAAHRGCVEEEPDTLTECGYGGYARDKDLMCYTCEESVPEEMANLIKLSLL